MPDMQSPETKVHWNQLTPARLLVVLLAVEIGMFFCEGLFPKGWAVLIVTTAVVVTAFYLFARLAWAFPPHRPFQYSIRSMLIFTAIIALAGGWMAQRMREAAKQKQALGLAGKGIPKSYDVPTFPFLEDLFGEDFFIELSDAYECDYYESNATDTDLEYVKRFKKLKALSIRRNPAITDAGLERLKDLKQLTDLLLEDASITDAGLRHLEALENLEELHLNNTRVTGAGLKHLAGLEHLRTLRFWNGAISDEGLENIQQLSQLEDLSLRNDAITDTRLAFLKEMKNLRDLDLANNPVTDSGLVYLKELKQIQFVDLGGTAITDNGLAQLRAFGELKRLDLNNTGITDAGIADLRELKQLRVLSLFGTKITGVGIDNLSYSLPNTEIHWK